MDDSLMLGLLIICLALGCFAVGYYYHLETTTSLWEALEIISFLGGIHYWIA